MATRIRLELTTSSVTGSRSNQLNYRATEERANLIRLQSLHKVQTSCLKPNLRNGAADEARTRYLHLGKVALYQMSYGRMAESLVLSRSLRATNAIIWHSM